MKQDLGAEIMNQRSKRLVLLQAKAMWQQRGRRMKPFSNDDPRQTYSHEQRLEAALEMATSNSSIHLIPPEVWSLIFQFAMPEDEYIRPSIHKAPLLFCQVSRIWRDVAISTPQLWNSISVGRVHRRGAAPWLRRSGQLPLAIELTISHPSHQSLHQSHCHWQQTISLLLSYADRWSHMRLSVPRCLVPHLLSRPMPNLYVLELGSSYAMADVHVPPTLAPKLRHIALLTTSLDPAPLLSLPWDQLTHFSSRHWADVHAHLTILQRCAGSLVHCQLHALHSGWCLGQSPMVPGLDIPLLLPRLRRLEIVACTSAAMVSVLDRLTLPSLEELTLVVPEESPWGVCEWPMSSIYALVGRSSAGVLKVALTGMVGEGGVNGSCSNSSTVEVLQLQSTH
ncbi:hypothetical protein BKA70DRAFT_1260080 [Coprinopsis sp. MPI-PUGE-AT-0042]|nr:hypothetical protein BKA70DRAFT_1260080 [Coprinopsis sp. MPI-PUGE-AT-0042]